MHGTVIIGEEGTDEGDIVGTKNAEFGKIFINPQSGEFGQMLEQKNKKIKAWIMP